MTRLACWLRATGIETGGGRPRGTAPIDDLAYGPGVHGIALERLDERLLELGDADRIQNLDQTLCGIAIDSARQ
jgi:hypothetical protein